MSHYQRNIKVVLSQLRNLALMQGERTETAEQLQEALSFWQSVNEPASKAKGWHQIGIVYHRAGYWEAAEQAYRKAAHFKETQGLLGGINGAVNSWNQLAQVCAYTGRKAEAEQWFSKALTAFKEGKDWPNTARVLSNLAALLAKDPARLDEACSLAEESLAIKETFDPARAEIWNTYRLLAHIAEKQGDSSQAAAYRSKAEQAYFAFPGWREQLRQYKDLIEPVVQAAADAAMREKLEQALNESAGGPRANLIAAIQRILSGERNEAALIEPLDYEEAAVIRAILEGIAGKG